MEIRSKKGIIFLLWVLICTYLHAGWYYKSNGFPLIQHVIHYKDKLYFIVSDCNALYIIEKHNNKFNEYKYPLEKNFYEPPNSYSFVDSTEEKIFIRIASKELSFDFKNKTFKEESEFVSFYREKKEKKEFVINDTLMIEFKNEDYFDLPAEIILKHGKVESIPLPPLCYKSFIRLRPEHAESLKKWIHPYRKGETLEMFVAYDYNIGDTYLIGNKIWFLINFYDGEGYEGAGGIGYFDYYKKEIGIARIPELNDYSAKATFLLGKNIWIAPANFGEGYITFPHYVIEFNTETGKYRIYDFKNTAFRNFGIVKIFKLNKKNLCFLTGNEAIIYNLKNHKWERYTIMLKVMKDSAQTFYLKAKNIHTISESKKITVRYFKESEIEKIPAQYVKKNEIFYPLYFMQQGPVEIETPFYICGKSIDEWAINKNLKIDSSPIWNIFEGPLFLKTQKGILLIYASPIKSVKKISDSLFYVCVKGVFINKKDVIITIRKTKEGVYLLPKWKSFSENPFLEMKREVKRMWKEFKECKEYIQNRNLLK